MSKQFGKKFPEDENRPNHDENGENEEDNQSDDEGGEVDLEDYPPAWWAVKYAWYFEEGYHLQLDDGEMMETGDGGVEEPTTNQESMDVDELVQEDDSNLEEGEPNDDENHNTSEKTKEAS